MDQTNSRCDSQPKKSFHETQAMLRQSFESVRHFHYYKHVELQGKGKGKRGRSRLTKVQTFHTCTRKWKSNARHLAKRIIKESITVKTKDLLLHYRRQKTKQSFHPKISQIWRNRTPGLETIQSPVVDTMCSNRSRTPNSRCSKRRCNCSF